MKLRSASNSDSQSLIRLIEGVYHEYGEVLCLEGADRDLLDLEAYYFKKHGAFIVMENSEGIVGCHATLPLDEQKRILTLRRLYLRKEFRGGPQGRELMNWAIDWATAKGYGKIQFWSDTRFKRAHRFFEKYGFNQEGIREMNDGFLPYSEYGFHLSLMNQPAEPAWAGQSGKRPALTLKPEL